MKSIASCDLLRVLFISHDSALFGAQRMLLALLAGLEQARFSPYLLVPAQGDLVDAVNDLGVPVFERHLEHWVPCMNMMKGRGRLSCFTHMLRGLRARSWAIAALIERYKIDLVYTNTVTCIEGAVAARMTKKPHLWHIHEPVAGNSELLPLLPAFLYAPIIAGLSTRVVFPSHTVAADYPRLRERASIVYNGIQLPSRQNRMQVRDEVARRLATDPSQYWVAVVGAIQPRKDHRTFLAAAKNILQQRDDVHFIIVGAGAADLVRALRDQVDAMGLTDRVTLAGRWEGEIALFLAAIDVLVISSEQESFGLTAIESMAVETPVVATRCGGPSEIIEDGSNGFLVDVKDALGMADAVLKLLADPAMRLEFGRSGRARVSSHFTEHQYVQGVQDVLLELSRSQDA